MSATDLQLPAHPFTGLTAVGIVNGRPVWPILGASEDDDSNDAGADDEASDDDANDDANDDDASDDGDDQDDDTDWKAEADKYKNLLNQHKKARKGEVSQKRLTELRQAEKDLADLRAKDLPEAERAIKEAKDQGRAEARAEFAQQLAAAEIKAALTGIVDDPADIVEDINIARFVTDDGDVDADAVDTLRQKYAKYAKPADPKDPNLHQGKSRKTPPSLASRIAAAEQRGDHKEAVRLRSEALLKADA